MRLQKDFSARKLRQRAQRIAVTFAAIMICLLTMIPHQASADTGLSNVNFLPQCGDITLGLWDWGASIKALSGKSDFDYSSSSYVVVHTANPFGDGNTTNHNRYKVYMADPGHKITLTQISSVPKVWTDNASIRSANLISEPQDMPEYKGNWTGSFSANQKSATNDSTFTGTTGNSLLVFAGSSSDTDGLDCEFVAHNANYGNAWGYDVFNSNVLHGTGSTTTCALYDAPCLITKAFSGIQNTLVSITQAVMGFFINLFEPDSAQMATDYNTFSSFMSNKLGFLSYPFTFIGNIFTAFTDTSHSWCTSTSCSKDFGNFFGHDFTVDLIAPLTAMPSLWSWFLLLIRGTTIVVLLLAVRNKYMGVVRK